MLDIKNVHKTFFAGTVNERVALQEINLSLAAGEFVTVIGSNGAGKSTILNITSGTLRPDTGTVSIDGQDVTRLADHQRARYVGRVFQDPMAGTAPEMTIEENLAIAYERGKRRGLRPGVTRKKREFFKRSCAPWNWGWRTGSRPRWDCCRAASGRPCRC